MTNFGFPWLKVPDDTQQTLYLIREELKSRKFFYVMGKVGLDDCFFPVHLDIIIMDCLGMNDGTDETYSIYDAIVEKHAREFRTAKHPSGGMPGKSIRNYSKLKNHCPLKMQKNDSITVHP